MIDRTSPVEWPTAKLQSSPLWPDMIQYALVANMVMHEAGHRLLTDKEIVEPNDMVGLIFEMAEATGFTAEQVMVGSLVLLTMSWQAWQEKGGDACALSLATHDFWKSQLHALS